MSDNKNTLGKGRKGRGGIARRTGQLALSGVMTGLALAIMLATLLLPSMTYALPMVAGALLVIPCIEFGTGAALTAYVAVSILSFILPVDKEAALMFVLLFGLYPILKKYFEQIKPRLIELLVKLLYFNAAAIGAGAAAWFVFRIPIDDGSLGRWAIPILLAAGNVLFFIYDYTLTLCITVYLRRLQPVFRKILQL